MPTLDLPATELNTLKRILARYVPCAEVWAYGSRVTGGAHEGSDLDLVVRMPSDGSRANLAELRDAFSESDLPILVDVFDWKQIPKAFWREIEKAHVVLQK